LDDSLEDSIAKVRIRKQSEAMGQQHIH
jgi:hypothetical protein